MGLDLDVNTHLLTRGREVVGGHVGVGDAGRTSCDGDDVGGGCLFGSCRVCRGGGGGCRYRRVLLWFDDPADEVDDRLSVGGLAQLLDEFGLDEGASQLREELHVVGTTVLGGSDHEDEVSRAVRSVEVNCGGQPGEAE